VGGVAARADAGGGERSPEKLNDVAEVIWPESDMHLDLHDLRLALDPRPQARARTRKLAHDRAFGNAVRALRQQHGLAQNAIPGLSARHLRRIVNGYVPGLDAIDALARAHRLDPDRYLEAVTERMD